MSGDDVSSNEIPLSVALTFFGDRFSSIFVNNNGHLSFQTEIPNFAPDLNFPNRYQVRMKGKKIGLVAKFIVHCILFYVAVVCLLIVTQIAAN